MFYSICVRLHCVPSSGVMQALKPGRAEALCTAQWQDTACFLGQQSGRLPAVPDWACH